MNRRDFLLKTGVLGGGTLLMSDPLMASFSKLLGLEVQDYIKQFSHSCDLLRSEDLLHLRFYFVNLKLKSKYLQRVDKSISSQYMLVRIPQQHIAENTISVEELGRSETTSAFIAGYSFLCFKLKESEKGILKYDEANLLDWSKFDLITLDDLDNLDELKNTVPSFNVYPNELVESTNNHGLKFFFTANDVKLPVSIVEIYKLFLSPIAPVIRGKRGRQDYGYVFKDPKNKLVEYLSYGDKDRSTVITRPWENDLIYSIQYNTHKVELPPNFKAIAYQGDQEEGALIPNGYERKQIVEHTLLDFDTDERDVVSELFRIGALGVTTKLKYDNLYAKKGSSFVGWKHDIKNGRDNYVEVVYIGIDLRTNKKVLVARTGERLHHYGRSLFVERNFMSYVDLTQTYDNKDFLYSKSEILKNGFYFKPYHFDDKEGKVSNRLEYGKLGPKPFIPVSEDSPENKDLADPSVKIIYQRSVKYDKQGVAKELASHIAVVFKAQYEERIEFDKANSAHKALTQKPAYRDLLKEYVRGEKMAYVEAMSKGKVDDNRNTSLATDYFQFQTKRRSDNFYDPHPLSLHLVYAKIKAPQMEGLSDEKYYHFAYTDSFVNVEVLKQKSLDLAYKIRDFDPIDKATHFKYEFKNEELKVDTSKALEAAKTYNKDLEKKFNEYDALQSANRVYFKSINKRVELQSTEGIDKEFDISPEPISKVLSNNNAKSLINPDPVIQGLSLLDQGVTLAEDVEIDVSKNLLNPKDILKGMNAEIFKGIKLVDILKQVIPLDQSPIFEVIEEARQGIFLIENYAKKYQEALNEVKNTTTELKEASSRLLNSKITEVEQYIKKRLELEREIFKKKVEDTVISPFESELDKVLNDVEKVKDLVEITAQSSFDEIKKAVEKLLAKEDIQQKYQKAGVFALREKNVKGLLRVLDYLKTTSNEKLDGLTLVIQDQLSRYRSEVKIALRTPISDASNYLLDDFNKFNDLKGLDSKLKQLCQKEAEEIHVEVINKIRKEGKDSLYIFDRIQQRVRELAKKAENKTIAKKLSDFDRKIDFFLYYYYENKLLFENQLEIVKGQAFAAAGQILVELERAVEFDKMVTVFQEIEGLYNYYSKISASQDHLKKKFEFLLMQINESSDFKFLKNHLDEWGVAIDNIENIVRYYKSKEEELMAVSKQATEYFNTERNKIESEIKALKQKLTEEKEKIENFIEEALKEERNRLNQLNEALSEEIRNHPTSVNIDKFRRKVGVVEKNIRKILDSNKKKVNYSWNMTADSFSNFQSDYVSFFKTSHTRLEVDVRSEINYKLSLDSSPKYVGTDYFSSNTLENFSLNFFNVIAIDFAEIRFVTGSKVDTDFEVNIKKITFSGALSFLQAFEPLLDALFFIQSLMQGGIQVDYNLALPEIEGGAFNFLNGKFHAGVYLPIGSDKPMRLDVGVNSPDDMFLVTYGYFGGRGCFQIGLTPKDGVVKILLIIEIGGVILINAGVAKGYVYLFAGIYYRKLINTVEIRGYLVAGGCLNIAGLVNASVTFVMGLKSDGKNLIGYCSVNYTVKIGEFFEKTFRLPYQRVIKGTESKKTGEKNQSEENVAMELFTEVKSVEKEFASDVWRSYLTSFKVI